MVNQIQALAVLVSNNWIAALLVSALAMVGIYASKIYRPVFRWFSKLMTRFGDGEIKEISGDETLDKAISAAGYDYEIKQDIFFSVLDPWQRSMGYCRLYDEAAAPLNMIIDCEPIYFEYGGKRWMIEFWKGQYALTIGCEIGVYNTDGPDLNIPGVFNGTFYNCASNEELLKMAFTLKKNGETLFKRKDKHWWLTGFVLGGFAEPSELVMDMSITLKDREMRDAFVKGLIKAGYSINEIQIYRNTVSLTFDKTRTPQPYTRIPSTDWVIQRKNELLCNMYQDITKDYDNFPDKVRAIKEKAPQLYKELANIGKTRQLFEIYDKLKAFKCTGGGILRRNTLKHITEIFESAEEISFDDSSKFVLMSDCHRGDGSWADGFSKNQNIYFAALNQYYNRDYTYIELGDGDELWEKNKLSDIIHVHRDAFWILSRFYNDGRLHFLYGNHDMVKKDEKFVENNLYEYFDERKKEYFPLFENIKVHEGLILRHKETGKKIFLIHGHQVDFFNYRLWKVGRFLSSYLWKPLQLIGINDPTSTAKNYAKKNAIGNLLTEWAVREGHTLIAGHTHRPAFPEADQPQYFNTGSCVHPRCITAIEIAYGHITLVKWSVKTTSDGTLYIGRDVLAGPRELKGQ
jgi:UDP-2,3-diacylglucosamine pyrophosphatase LpxH